MMRLPWMAFLLATTALGQSYQPSEANLQAREWFQNARFGMFIHWGVYSVLGDGEWVMNTRKMTVTEYEKLAPQFNPTEYNAAEWVALARAAGMKYITITSKHHDGFAMWGTKQNHWNIVDATPYKKDVLKMLADECHRQGIKLFFYHSELDWHSPDYYPRGRTGQTAGRPESGYFNRYLEFMDNRLRELLTGYGDIAGIWFDGWWDKPDADWHLDRTYRLIHSLQPAALIANNHHRMPFPGEDFQMFEKDLPGQKTAEFNTTSEVGKLPLASSASSLFQARIRWLTSLQIGFGFHSCLLKQSVFHSALKPAVLRMPRKFLGWRFQRDPIGAGTDDKAGTRFNVPFRS